MNTTNNCMLVHYWHMLHCIATPLPRRVTAGLPNTALSVNLYSAFDSASLLLGVQCIGFTAIVAGDASQQL